MLAVSLAGALIRQLPVDGYRAHSVQLQNEVSDVSPDREEFLNTTGPDLLSGRDRACADELLEIYVAAKEVIRLQLRDGHAREQADDMGF